MYCYEEMKLEVLNEKGFKGMVQQVDHMRRKFSETSSPVNFEDLLSYGDSWFNMAVVELCLNSGLIREVTQMSDVPTNYRKFCNIGL